MGLDTTTIEKIANLAKLTLDPEMVPLYAQQLSNILDLAQQMQAIDTDAITPMTHPIKHARQRLRADEVLEANQQQTLLALAPSSTDNLYLVPQVIAEGNTND